MKLICQVQRRLQVVGLLSGEDNGLFAMEVRKKRFKLQVTLGRSPAFSFSFASELFFFLS